MRALVTLVASLAALTAGTAQAAEGGLPQLNAEYFAPQLIWLVLSFLLLFVIMAWVALPRIGEVLEERRERITRDLQAAERLKVETEKALAAYEKAIGEARSNASQLARQTRESLAGEVERERAKLEREIGAKVAAAEASIGATKAKALAGVTEIATDTVAAIVDKLIGQEATREEIVRALGPGPGGGT